MLPSPLNKLMKTWGFFLQKQRLSYKIAQLVECLLSMQEIQDSTHIKPRIGITPIVLAVEGRAEPGLEEGPM